MHRWHLWKKVRWRAMQTSTPIRWVIRGEAEPSTDGQSLMSDPGVVGREVQSKGGTVGLAGSAGQRRGTWTVRSQTARHVATAAGAAWLERASSKHTGPL